MMVRKKTLVICLMLVGLLGLLCLFSRSFLLSSFAKLEDRELRQDLERADGALADDLSYLDRTTSDYSNWDQTYAFIENRNPNYTKTEFPTQSVQNNLRVNLVVIVDSSDKVVFAKAVDLVSGKDAAFPQSLMEKFAPGAALSRHENIGSKLVGTMLLPEGPLLLDSRPILTSMAEGPIRGTMIMGRWLDAIEIRRLGEMSRLSVALMPLHSSEIKDGLGAEPGGEENKGVMIRRIDSDRISAYKVLNDLYGKPALALSVETPRTIYKQAQVSLFHFTVLYMTAGLAFGILILFLLETLERSEAQRNEKETRIHLIISQVPAVLWTTDTALLFTSLQGAGLETFGLKPNQLVGLSLASYFQANGQNSPLISGHRRAIRGEPGSYEHEWGGRSFHSHVEPLRAPGGTILGTIGIALDITERKRAEALLVGEKQILEMITRGDSLANVLAMLARTVEGQSSGIVCSVLLLEPDGITLRQIAAPSLPESYTAALDAMPTGAGVGSLAVAAHTLKRVIVPDIARDAMWADHQELPLTHGLTACWAVPIVSTKGVSLGTIAVFCGDVRDPSKLELDVMERAAHLVAITTERKRAEEEMVHSALHDSLTNLPNRTLFLDRLRREFNHAKRHPDHTFAILFIDIDGFKKVNDSLGHTVGDQLIVEISRRLTTSLRQTDTVSRPTTVDPKYWPKGEDTLARLGGDEFTVLLNDVKGPADAIRAAERIQTILADSYILSGHEVFVSASIGIALSTTAHEAADDLLRDADIAMYRAKAQGKARFEIFDTAMHDRAVNRLNVETALRKAVDREEFRLFYQPIVCLDNGRVAGFEALLRWQRPDGALVAPGDFIGVAEETGLILPIGKWVLYEACRQLRVWQNVLPSNPALTMSVNMSARQFAQADLAEQVGAALQQTGLAASSLKLEITESIVMEDAEKTQNILAGLKRLRVRLAIDDFGTGYSSLSYLRRLPFDTLKIDRSFINSMAKSSDNREIVSIIVTLASNLGMDVVAEGLETAEQVARLQDLKCQLGQGYIFSKPMSADAAEHFLQGSRKSQGSFLDSTSQMTFVAQRSSAAAKASL